MRPLLTAAVTLAVALALATTGTARAEGTTRHRLRLATIAPDGTHWARELRAFAREVTEATRGEVEVKWYFGGIAGNEDEMRTRLGRGELDGVASGGPVCHASSPTMRVLTMRGLFQSRDEASHVMTRMKATLEEEFAHSGLRFIGSTALGPELAFLQRDVRSFDELRKQRLWMWADDPAMAAITRDLGLTVVTSPIYDASRLFASGDVDGILTSPTALLAFQWLPLIKTVVALPLSFGWGCLTVTSRAFDRLPVEARDAILAAAAKTSLRIGEAGRRDDEQLLGGVFLKSGVRVIVPTEAMRAQYMAAARAARERIPPTAISHERLRQVQALLADFRAEHDRTR